MEILDISHLIRPFGVREGAAVLAEAVAWFPSAVHLAVVDPGVGSDRRAVVVRAGPGLFVGPDNGLLVPAADRLGGITEAHVITNPSFGLPSRSTTFHGRDVFAPAAAHLAAGVPPSELGPPADPRRLVRLPAPVVAEVPGGYRAEIVLVDRFGNLQTSLLRNSAQNLGLEEGRHLRVTVEGRSEIAVFRTAYAFGQPGELQVLEDSHGSLAVSVNQGRAADRFGAPVPGAPVTLTVGGEEGEAGGAA